MSAIGRLEIETRRETGTISWHSGAASFSRADALS